MSPVEVLRTVIPERRRLVAAIGLALLGNVSAVALLATSMWLIVRAAERPPILLLGFAVVGVRAFALGRAFFRYVERLVSHDAVFRQLPQLRARVFARLADLAPLGTSTLQRGDAISRFIRDIDELPFFPLRVLVPTIASVLGAGLSVVALALWSPLASALDALIIGAGCLAAFLIARSSASRQARSIVPALGEVADAVLDTVTHWDVLVAYGADASARARVERVGAELSARERVVAGQAGLASALLTVTAGGAIAANAWIASTAVLNAQLTVPEAAVLALLPLAIVDALAVIPAAVIAHTTSRGAAERIAALVPQETPIELPDERQPSELEVHELPDARLSLRAVSARYPGATQPALLGVSLEIAPGDLVLIRGASGSGKSTLAHVLVRLLEYDGSIVLGGRELRALGAESARANIVLCEQQPWLFHSTVRGNLAFARPGVADRELEAVLDRVGLGDWLASRGGLDALVGERGGLVSGGEAQRLALARALLSSAPMIICDEPTANVDPDRAAALLRDIAALAPERTVLLLSHDELPASASARSFEMVDGRLR
ncbi:MAG: thiol reductant ABC exporter subunit CydC [Agromyces sp.]